MIDQLPEGNLDFVETDSKPNADSYQTIATKQTPKVLCSSMLEYGVVHLKIEDIIVGGHTRCGGIAAIKGGVHENDIADWLYRVESGATEILVDGRHDAAQASFHRPPRGEGMP